MAKDPAVLFYPSDFLIGTAFMTEAQVGAYIRILCHLFDKDSLVEQDMIKICSTYDIWNSIQDKFDKDTDGKYYNKRAREEKLKRVKYSESRANNRKNKGKEKITNDHILTYQEDMENENINENINIDLNEVKNLEGVSLQIQRQIRSVFIGAWKWNIPTDHLMRIAIDFVKEYGIDKVKQGALICSEYERGKWNFKYLAGVMKGIKAAETTATIKDREQRAAAMKQAEKDFTPDPETAKIFRDLLNELDKKSSQGMQPKKDFDQKKRNEEFRNKVEKGEIK